MNTEEFDKVFKNHFVLDVESDGPHPVSYNMISFGLVNISDNSNSFLGEVSPIYDNAGIEEARDISGVSFKSQKLFRSYDAVMLECSIWTHNITGGNRPVIWSDNPAFDWQFFNAYIHMSLGENPFGHSARRIGDLYSGLTNDIRNASKWKKFRKTKHTHNPIDDAKGNTEAIRQFMTRDLN